MFRYKSSLVEGTLLPSVLRDLIQIQLAITDSPELRTARASVETEPAAAQRAWVGAVCDRAGVERATSVSAIKAIRDAYPQLSLADAVDIVRSAFGNKR